MVCVIVLICLLVNGRLPTILAVIARKLKRSKAPAGGWSLRFTAVDGHELFSLTPPLLPPVFNADR